MLTMTKQPKSYQLNKGIKCPNCYKGDLKEKVTQTKNYAECPSCNINFIVLGKNTVMYD